MTKDKKNKDSSALEGYMSKLSRNAKSYIIDKIAEGCMVPRYTVKNWMSGMARIPELHKCKIEQILEEKIFEQNI